MPKVNINPPSVFFIKRKFFSKDKLKKVYYHNIPFGTLDNAKKYVEEDMFELYPTPEGLVRTWRNLSTTYNLVIDECSTCFISEHNHKR